MFSRVTGLVYKGNIETAGRLRSEWEIYWPDVGGVFLSNLIAICFSYGQTAAGRQDGHG